MPFVSYAQNFEDVLLWRALKSVPKGVYLDVGASHPVADSVTFAFYERGWRGINIEPVAADHALLAEQRPGDINLNLAAGDRNTVLPLYQFGVRGLATLSPAVTDHHKKFGLSATSIDVKVVPLRDICAEYVTGEIHFLKIDVEGSEAEVLRGMDFQRWRPWVLLVEATLPNSQEPTHLSWESLLLEQGYVYCYFDGLSRYYVAKERERALAPLLSCQPNVFDHFTTAPLARAQTELEKARASVDEVNRRWAAVPDGPALARKVADLEKQVTGLQTELTAAREAWASMEVAAMGARRTIVELEGRIAGLHADPFFKTGKTLRALTQRLAKRSNP
ncbi:MAG: FkbM family methyltransferase [Archangium sp.]|nr:FkbM family methyltransferase [Archangium sp.]MDP3151038.1 FkbM family methyltransferase [Archangium sp.]MDP3569789.1 FkbM family methyltransferase [Archangium sp.]